MAFEFATLHKKSDVPERDPMNVDSLVHPDEESRGDPLVHIVEPDEFARGAHFRMLRTLGFPCDIYSSVEELLRYGPRQGIVLFHEDAKASTADLVTKLRNAGLPLRIIAYRAEPAVSDIVKAVQAGAVGYVAAPFNPPDLVDALRQGIQGSAASLAGFLAKQDAIRRINSLSPREKEVLDLMSEGLSNKEIARNLGISPRTVEIHRMKMLGKLGAANAIHAAFLLHTAGELHRFGT